MDLQCTGHCIVLRGQAVIAWLGISPGQWGQMHFIDCNLNAQTYLTDPLTRCHGIHLQPSLHVAAWCCTCCKNLYTVPGSSKKTSQFLHILAFRPSYTPAKSNHQVEPCSRCSGWAFMTACSNSCQHPVSLHSSLRGVIQYSRWPQSTTWSTLCKGEVSHCMRQMVVTDTGQT